MEILLLSLLFGVYVFSLGLFLFRVVFNGKSNLEKALDAIQAMGKKGETGKREAQKKKKKKKIIGFDVSEKLREELESSGIKMSGQEYLLLWGGLITFPSMMVYFLTGRIGMVLPLLAVCVVLPPVIVKMLRKKRLEKFSGQLGDALMTVSNCLRSGFSFRQAIDRVSTDMPNPIAEEFKTALQEVSYGASMESALGGIARRMENSDMEMINSAIIVQQQVGGNLSEVIDNISDTIKDRIRIRQSLKTLTAQGRMSGLILGLLPVFALVFLTFINPEYMSTFYTTDFGKMLLIVSFLMECTGFLVIRKIVNIKI
ncbi:type II secretion system F family protein [Clostridium sp. AM58-1XD]|uniref:type II secretion system F family protein n=1 Tax=Clostridium sp. AM58-1XD TaxID=2292307 RepID=UPI000E4B455E|nr:type II secretion system F family protein [Clostridium sp. AM58-1XD]RGY97918.1 type II secretion protein F [Clostridium sp. AM58-1XD]